MRPVPHRPPHHLDHIGHVKGEAQYVDVVHREEVKALQNALRPHYHLQMLSLVVIGAVEDAESLFIARPFLAGDPEEIEGLEGVIGAGLHIVVARALSAPEAYRSLLHGLFVLEQAVFLERLAEEVHAVQLHLVKVNKTLSGLREDAFDATGKLGRKGAQGLRAHERTVNLFLLWVVENVAVLTESNQLRVASLQTLDEGLDGLALELYVSEGLVGDVFVRRLLK